MFKKTKKGLISVVLMLALSSVMAAMSYSTASVESPMSVKLTNTQDALLALVASDEHNAAYYDDITSDILNINLSKGLDNGDYGVQPFSVYEWDDLFAVKNNSEHAVDVSIKLKDSEGSRINIYAKGDSDSWTRINGIHSAGGVLTFTLQPGAEQAIDFKTDSLNGWEAEKSTKLIVEGKKSE